MYGDSQQALRLAFVAGLMEGEGSFCICKHVSNPETMAKYGWRTSPMNAHVRIGMTDLEAIEFVANTFPGCGKITHEGVRKDRPTYKKMYRWDASNRQHIIKILDALLPYLMFKKDRALIVYEYCTGWKSLKHTAKHGNHDPEELQRREDLYMKCKKLNAVGAAATTESVGPETVSNSLDLSESLGGKAEEPSPPICQLRFSFS